MSNPKKKKVDERAIIVTGGDSYEIQLNESFVKVRDELLNKTASIQSIDSEFERDTAIASAAELKGISKAVENLREEVKKPFLDAGRKIDATAKEASTKVIAETKRIEALIGDYQRRETARIEEARRQMREAEERAEAERRRLEEERLNAELEGDEEKVAEIDEQIVTSDLEQGFTSPAPEIEDSKPQGATVKTEFTFEVIDIWRFLEWDLERRRKYPQLPTFVKVEVKTADFKQYLNITSPDDHAKIPGVKVTEKTKAIVRASTPLNLLQ